jgi:hypothetical protein
MKQFFLTLAALSLAPGALAGADASATCGLSFQYPTILWGRCGNGAGSYYESSLDLSECLVNKGGIMYAQAK